MVGATDHRSFVVVAPGVDMMFKAGSFEIRRLMIVQVPQSNFEDRRSDAILDIGSREQNLSTGLKIKRLSPPIISRCNPANSDFVRVHLSATDYKKHPAVDRQQCTKSAHLRFGNKAVIAYQRKLGLIADHTQLLTLARENKTWLQDAKNKHVFVK